MHPRCPNPLTAPSHRDQQSHPNRQRNSSLAVWSLVLGCLTPCCFGPLAGIGAVICGHRAFSEIGKSGGSLGGRTQATIGLVLGYAGSVVWFIFVAILMALLFPAISIVTEQARRAEAKAAVVNVSAAVKGYYTEYGKYPLAASTSKNVAMAGDNNRLFDILRARPGTEAENPRRIVFFEKPRTRRRLRPKSGFGTDGVFYDPWGRPYQICIDPSGDDLIPNPDDPTGPPIRSGVIVWSFGSDRARASQGNKAHIISW